MRNPFRPILARRSLRKLQGRRLRPNITPQSGIYLLVHLLIFLVGILLIRVENPVWQGIGASVMAVGITGWLLYIVVRTNDHERLRREAVDDLGLIAAFPQRSIPIRNEYDRRLATAKEHIDVMGFGLAHLREEYLDQLAVWAEAAPVRILLVDPDTPGSVCSYVSQRDAEEGLPPGTTSATIAEFLRQTLDLRRASPTRFSIRLCTALPSINFFRIDYEAFWGPYLVAHQDRDKRSRNLPTLIVDQRGFMFGRLVEHFNTLWSSDEFSRRPSDEDW